MPSTQTSADPSGSTADPSPASSKPSRGARAFAWFTSGRPDSLWLACLFVLIAATASALVIAFETAPGRAWFYPKGWGKSSFDAVMLVGSSIGLGVLVGYALLRRFAFVQRLRRRRGLVIASKLLIALLVFVMGLNYFYARRASARDWVHFHDTYHYALGPKYYAEYDYFWHYKCTIEAASEKAIPDRAKTRSLWNYEFVTAGEVREPRQCEEKFTPARWAEYKRDIELYAGHNLRGPINDLGYNGTPLHALFAGSLINRFELSYETLALAGLLDVWLICIMLFFVARSFGWRLGLAFALVIFTAVVDRYGVIGGSWFRWSWWFSLGLGIVALREERWSLAAFWLVAAAMLNVFPLLFLIGASLSLIGQCVRARALLPAAKRFVAGAVISTLALGALSVSHARGVGNYRDFFEDMRVHKYGPPIKKGGEARQEKYPGYGVGLKFIFMYRGKHHKKTKGYNRTRLTREYREIKPIIQGIGALLAGAAALICLRLNPVEAAILFGFTAFYGLLGTVHYYFACASLLVLLWYRRVKTPAGLLFICGYFACNVVGHTYLHTHNTLRVLYNTLLSSLWLVYLVAMLVYLARETGWTKQLAQLLAAPAATPVSDESAP